MAPSSAQPDGQPESAGHDLPTNPDGTLDLSRMTNEDIAGQMHYAALDIAHSAQSGDADAYGRSIRDFFMERDELLGRIRQMPWGLGRVLAERQYGKAISSAYEAAGIPVRRGTRLTKRLFGATAVTGAAQASQEAPIHEQTDDPDTHTAPADDAATDTNEDTTDPRIVYVVPATTDSAGHSGTTAVPEDQLWQPS